jgi:hypothetical protein
MEEEGELVERKKHGGRRLRGLGNIVLGLGLGFCLTHDQAAAKHTAPCGPIAVGETRQAPYPRVTHAYRG